MICMSWKMLIFDEYSVFKFLWCNHYSLPCLIFSISSWGYCTYVNIKKVLKEYVVAAWESNAVEKFQK